MAQFVLSTTVLPLPFFMLISQMCPSKFPEFSATRNIFTISEYLGTISAKITFIKKPIRSVHDRVG